MMNAVRNKSKNAVYNYRLRLEFYKPNKFHSDSDAIVILVQLIKHPNISITELSNKLPRQGVMIEPEMITSFLEYHELLEKKTGTIKP